MRWTTFLIFLILSSTVFASPVRSERGLLDHNELDRMTRFNEDKKLEIGERVIYLYVTQGGSYIKATAVANPNVPPKTVATLLDAWQDKRNPTFYAKEDNLSVAETLVRLPKPFGGQATSTADLALLKKIITDAGYFWGGILISDGTPNQPGRTGRRGRRMDRQVFWIDDLGNSQLSVTSRASGFDWLVFLALVGSAVGRFFAPKNLKSALAGIAIFAAAVFAFGNLPSIWLGYPQIDTFFLIGAVLTPLITAVLVFPTFLRKEPDAHRTIGIGCLAASAVSAIGWFDGGFPLQIPMVIPPLAAVANLAVGSFLLKKKLTKEWHQETESDEDIRAQINQNVLWHQAPTLEKANAAFVYVVPVLALAIVALMIFPNAPVLVTLAGVAGSVAVLAWVRESYVYWSRVNAITALSQEIFVKPVALAMIPEWREEIHPVAQIEKSRLVYYDRMPAMIESLSTPPPPVLETDEPDTDEPDSDEAEEINPAEKPDQKV